MSTTHTTIERNGRRVTIKTSGGPGSGERRTWWVRLGDECDWTPCYRKAHVDAMIRDYAGE